MFLRFVLVCLSAPSLVSLQKLMEQRVENMMAECKDTGNGVCVSQGAVYMQNLGLNFTRTLSNPRTDVIFIIDASESITDENYNRILDILLFLIKYAFANADMKIHPDYAQVEIISFGLTAEPVVENMMLNNVTACQFQNVVRKISSRPRDQSHTNITAALIAAKQQFQKATRYADEQVVVIFSDGEYDGSFHIGYSYLRLSTDKIFTVGIGEYLNSDIKIENLKQLASDSSFYACACDWLQIFEEGSAGEIPADLDPIWAPITPEENALECDYMGSCPEHEECGCNVALLYPKYDCACSRSHRLKRVNNSCVACPKDSVRQGIGDEKCETDPTLNIAPSSTEGTESLGVIIGLVIGGIILLIALIVLVIVILGKCDKTKCCKKQSKETHTEQDSTMDGNAELDNFRNSSMPRFRAPPIPSLLTRVRRSLSQSLRRSLAPLPSLPPEYDSDQPPPRPPRY